MTTAPQDLNALRILELADRSSPHRDVMERNARSTINNLLELVDKLLVDKDLGHKELVDKGLEHKEVMDKDLGHKELVDKVLVDRDLGHKELVDKELVDKDPGHKVLVDKLVVQKQLTVVLGSEGFFKIARILLKSLATQEERKSPNVQLGPTQSPMTGSASL